ncbi:FG-GAP-like repeat-containing protein, partial [Allorhizocola rhizosphaerae]|uniref:FG-GAP-like repeat-containing protein n=1 Tax=Allorhizocola rhizosphaerae TaxID=1872709 RepID=UPI001B8B8B36
MGVTGGVESFAGENAAGVVGPPTRGPAGQELPAAADEPGVVSQVRVEVLDRAAAQAAGVNGLLLRVSRADGDVTAGEALLDIDYSGFGGAYGGDWASRLRLVLMPACVLTTPQVAACRRGTPVVSSRSDVASSRLSGQVPVGAGGAGGSAGQMRVWQQAGDDAAAADAGGGATVLAVASDPAKFARTNLTQASSWAAGTQSGDFTWSYPVGVPPVAGGLVPSVGLGYSSGSVDGRTEFEGSQTSTVGEGFGEVSRSFIERVYRPCEQDVLQRVSLAGGWNVFTKLVPLADFDGDGSKRPDFLGVTSAGEMWINFNTSVPGDPRKVGGTFISSGWGTITEFWPADVDGNGRTDLVGFDGSSVWIWRTSGGNPDAAPTFAAPVTLSGFSGFRMLPPADVDGDGKPDIVGVNAAGEMRYRRNVSVSGSVSISGTSSLISSGWGAVQHFFVGDFDGDGRVDITGRDNDTYFVWLLTGAVGAVPVVTARNFGGGWGIFSRFAPLLDYDRDGKPDIGGFTSAGELYVHLNTSTPGSVSKGWGGWITSGWSTVETVLAADFDGDTVNDLVGRDTGGTMWVWQGTGRPGLPQFGPVHYNASKDQCWRLPNATMVLDGRSVELVLDDATGVWKPSDDGATRVEQVNDGNGEWWKVTTADGTQYHFGRNKLPGWQAGDRETASRWVVPVFANHSAEPCLDAGTFGSSWCHQPWRWNLDYVVDVHGNSMSYWYARETNNVSLFDNPGAVAVYDRGGYLDRIEYGTRTGSGATRESRPDAVPPAAVRFAYAERCWGTCWMGTPWYSDPVSQNWYDTPWDLQCGTTNCPNSMAPSYFTAFRLVGVYTQTRDAASSSYLEVDRWELAHAYPATNDATSPSLWLDRVTHTGKSGAGPHLTDPQVTFVGERFANRAHFDAATTQPANKYRITNLHNGTGGLIQVYYDGVDCPAGTSNTPDLDNNTQRCFPQKQGEELTWWSKYRVSKVVEIDLVGGSPDITHSYTYSTDGSSTGVLWGFNSAARYSTRKAYRTWSNWRGYSTVTVTTGTDTGQQSRTTSLYMRGIHGDRVEGDWGDGNRHATITTSDGAVLLDEAHLAGFLRERIVSIGVFPNVQALSKTVHDPWWQQTSLRKPTPTWAIPPTTRGGFVRTGATTTKTLLTNDANDGVSVPTPTWRTTKTATVFDPVYGLPTRSDDLGDVATASDDLCTRVTYARNTTAWIVDKASRSETVGVACATTPAYPSDLVADSRTFFDGSTTFGTAPTRGLATKIEQAKSHNGTTPTYITTGEAGFDQWGRPLWTKDALGRQTTTTYTHDAAGRVSQIKVTNPATHTLTTNLDTARGTPITIVDANGKTTTGQYDTNGRLIKVWRPGHPTSGTPDAEYRYVISDTSASFVESKVLGPNGNQIASYEMFDGLLRPRQTQTVTEDGKRAITDLQYDKRGLQTKQSIFYNDAAAPSSTLLSFADTNVERQTRYVYDAAGRRIKDQLWRNNVLHFESTTIYDGDRVSVIPPQGGTRTQDIFDARGRVIEKRQHQSSANFTGPFNKTLYGYDDAGRLTTVTDPGNNTWTYGYDLLGRKTTSIDPDAGTSTSTYDNAGQVTSTTDARSQTLVYEYDNLGRKTKQRDGTATGPVMAEWTYDTVMKGQLTSSTRYVGTDAYTTRVTAFDDGYRPLHTET